MIVKFINTDYVRINPQAKEFHYGEIDNLEFLRTDTARVIGTNFSKQAKAMTYLVKFNNGASHWFLESELVGA